MTVLSAQSILRTGMVDPMTRRTQHTISGTSYGLSACGYDIRLEECRRVVLHPGRTVLAASLEKFYMPDDIVGVVHDKSTWARRGISVQNTVIEPGWCGYLTLELLYSPLMDASFEAYYLEGGTPIAQVIFHRLDEPTSQPYTGKYQDQEAGPQEAR